ncbi:hypothetical protein [Sphingosinicella rhizophila]|uniref:Uncharacterized protein n=1 Tax=Sphingosinicella rhizophila TaxID=3050082 RepID=A0ABU3Q3Z2_9SPHN|nr:hypothetical protein [Sphingosinicella sp. GR2756]MDT9597655.1 hypothetical protein [Sphingosinicella sp. GR2756]
MIAPVLPGETMQNLLLQARVVTDPIKSPLVGWWTEYYFFYVKLRDLDDRDTLTDMLVTNASVAGLATAADVPTNHRGDGINFSLKCLERVVDEYFRDDGEAFLEGAIDGLPLAAVDVHDFTDSAILDTATASSDDELPGENPTLPAHMSAFSDHYAHWEAMRDMQLTAATFEDWLKAFGVAAPREVREENHKPELIRYVREWSYPSNTINPADGAPSSAVSWSVAERADKDRFFAEPGFVFGVTVARPKVYFGNVEAAGSHYLDTPYAWLPAVLHSDPYTSLRKFTDTEGPLAATATGAYWIDIRDLFVHGDQYVNFAMTATDDSSVALPTAGMSRNYATSTDADALFVGAANKIKQDGRVDLRILSRIAEDTSL